MSDFGIRDVPCLSCQHGYGGPHRCDIPDYCACDRWRAHITVSGSPEESAGATNGTNPQHHPPVNREAK